METRPDDGLHAVLMSENALTVLEEIGCTPVPHCETWESATAIIQ